MKWIKLSIIDLYKMREVLDQSSSFTRSYNISDTQSYCEELMAEQSQPIELYSFESKKELYGFILLNRNFPLQGFTHIKLLVFKDQFQEQGYGSKIINQLKKEKGSLWIESPTDIPSLPFWRGKGFMKEGNLWKL